ncbi:DUF6431 domain-containing protein [Salibacterium qingdaonense]|uniref:DUF6431 domain-containing protein n=1 Tax=Salibacterium qingdaonense TaxID=266892 RepID=UPI001FE04782|nr:DUF6431 domain-containing protein [Salibacterium qingdaonense]
MEVLPCPVCRGTLRVIGSRNRIWKQADGSSPRLRLRRLRCQECSTVHHELPDLLIPHKHYDACCMEDTIAEQERDDSVVSAESSTMIRWKQGFSHWLRMVLLMLQTLLYRFGRQVPNSFLSPTGSSILSIVGPWVGVKKGWLVRLVQPLVNTHIYQHTRFAFLSR